MNKSIECIPFPEIENAYVVISARKTTKTPLEVGSNMSFFFNNGDIGAEWEPNYGPITVIYKCDSSHEDAQEHWFYAYCTGYGNWSQVAVEEEDLHRAFLRGDYEYIFLVLKQWSNR